MNRSVHRYAPDTRFRLKSPPVIAEAIDGEVMVINLESGAYYSVSGASAVVWHSLIGGAPLSSLPAVACARFDVDPTTLADDADAFVAGLVAEGVLVPDAHTPGAVPATDPHVGEDGTTVVPVAYGGLRFDRYDDMRALLIVDPVHDVGDFGWPSRPGDDAPT
ncbi:MAG: PqqD family protein [Betaproteobacteria bacterium]